MADRHLNPKPSKSSRHAHAPSVDTNASGIAESTISLGLSRFPEPPASIPTTPLRSEFPTASPTRSAFSPVRRTPVPSDHTPPASIRSAHSNPHAPLPKPPHTPSQFSGRRDPPQTPFSQVSPFDWHDGASSIAVDATEERLLPTSFITSLLEESKENLRQSKGSDAFSGISEMTYPPGFQQRPDGARVPPSAWQAQNKPASSSTRMSGDSETLHSLQGHSSVIRTASISRGVRTPGVSVVGYAPATLRSVSDAGSATTDGDTLRSMAQRAKIKNIDEEDESLIALPDKGHQHGYAESPALPSTAGTHQMFPRNQSRPNLSRTSRTNSVHSQKSVAPSFASRISSLRRLLAWKRSKPLPPVPILGQVPIIVDPEQRRIEEATPLPDLVNRAGHLHSLLEKGRNPHNSLTVGSLHPATATTSYDLYHPQRHSYHTEPKPNTLNDDVYYRQSFQPNHLSHRASEAVSAYTFHKPTPTGPPTTRLPRKRRLWVIAAVVLVAIAVAVGAGVGVAKSKKKETNSNCVGNLAGSTCTLDATCVCTATGAQCNGLARAVIDLIPVTNKVMQTNFTLASVYNSIWMMQGNPPASNCASQAELIDTGKSLTAQTTPNRTQWTQAALLWNAVLTQDTEKVSTLQSFVDQAPWSRIASADGPVSDSDGFTITVAGYSYDFAKQIILSPGGSFANLGQPTNDQLTRLSSSAQSTLDRMYTFAQAASIQQQTALKSYWTSVLQQQLPDLNTFRASFSAAPILLPFNASSSSIINLYPEDSSSSFPPPLACYPGLSSTLFQNLNTFETQVFGLSSSNSATRFDPSCYPSRPVYGVLDLLNLRLPYLDPSTGPVQAAMLARPTSPRAVVSVGQRFSQFNATINSTFAQLDPRQYGTLPFADHVILQYLSSMNVNTASALAQYVISASQRTPVPPSSSSPLFQALANVPVLEVAIFGSITTDDVSSTVSSFTTPSGALFFGSETGTTFRAWTINEVNGGNGGTVIWAQNATSPLVVRDTSLSDTTTISRTWDAITQAITRNIPNIGLSNITSTFTDTGDLRP